MSSKWFYWDREPFRKTILLDTTQIISERELA